MSRNVQDQGTDDVLADLGFPDADKTVLAKKINDILGARRLTRSDAAERLGMPQPKVSAIRNYKLQPVKRGGSATDRRCRVSFLAKAGKLAGRAGYSVSIATSPVRFSTHSAASRSRAMSAAIAR
jgi:predicted XRE-type DNA-binding protein